MSQLVHALSVDVEDWINAAVLWQGGRVMPPTAAVVENTVRLATLLEERGVFATWFVLGEVAETFPDLVRRLAMAGHEIGVHGYHHHRIHELSREGYRESIVRAKDVVEEAAGVVVSGYRAVAMSLTRDTWWAYDAVFDAGFRYSSSLFPTRASRHGVPDAPLGAHVVALAGGAMVEIPLTVVSVLGVRLPLAGGGYLRHFPLWLTRWGLRRLEKEGRPAVVYLHPYELDAEATLEGLPEDLDAGARRRIEELAPSQLRNRASTEGKLGSLLSGFAFAPLREVFADHLGAPGMGGR